MRAQVSACIVLVSSILYASIAFSYSAALRSSAERSAHLERASVERVRLLQGSSRLESLERKLTAELGRMTLVDNAPSFEVLLQRLALVARRSHVVIVGLVPEAGESREGATPFVARTLSLRIRGHFGEALRFIRVLPTAGILLRVRDASFAPRATTGSASQLDVTLRSALLRPAASAPAISR